MRARAVVVAGALVFFGAVAVSGRHAAADEKTKPAAAVRDLSGSWQLDKQLSDDARQKLRDSAQAPRGGGPRSGMGAPGGPGMGGGGPLGPPPGLDRGDDPAEAMRPFLDPAEELTVYQGQPEIVIEEKYVRRRTLNPDGRKHKADNGTAEVKTEWKEGRLVIETRGFRGRKTTESWELSATGSRLTSTVKLENGVGPAVTVKRVYDRAAGAPPPPDRD